MLSPGVYRTAATQLASESQFSDIVFGFGIHPTMPCVNRNCKVRTNLNREGLCQSCEQFWNDMNRRKEHHGRQQQAREAARDNHRNIGDFTTGPASRPPPQQVTSMSAPPPSTTPSTSVQAPSLSSGPPPVDSVHYPPVNVNIADLTNTYNQIKSNGVAPETSNKLLVDIYGMMVNMSAKQAEIDTVKTVVKSNTNRISELESKIGNAHQVSIPLSIAIRHLPPPPQGTSELQQVRHVLAAVRAEGVDPQTDVIKAVREGFKEESRPGANDGWLGTVLVELRTDEIKTKVMKTKKVLEDHQNQMLKNLIIKNAKTKAEMRMERMANSLLKLNPQGQNFYFAANGNLRPRNQHFQQTSNPRVPRQPIPTSINQPIPTSIGAPSFPILPQVNQAQSIGYYNNIQPHQGPRELVSGPAFVSSQLAPRYPQLPPQGLPARYSVPASLHGHHHHAVQSQQGVQQVFNQPHAEQHQGNPSQYVVPPPQQNTGQPVQAPRVPLPQDQRGDVHYQAQPGSSDNQQQFDQPQLQHSYQQQAALQDFRFGDTESDSDQ